MNEYNQPTEAFLLLEDGKMFRGFSFGKKGIAGGELCFNTAMTGYQEIITDPSYAGQVLIMSNVYVGSYGINEVDVESDKVQIKGLICRNITNRFSRMTTEKTIEDYLVENNVVAIHGIDTRALVQHIRDNGVMKCVISTLSSDKEDLENALKEITAIKGQDLAGKLATKEAYTYGNEDAELRVAVLDLGVKNSLLKSLSDLGLYLKVFPAQASYSDLASFNPDGIFVSNGPGDPNAMPYAVNTIKEILAANKPLFAIGLGNQLLALANDVPVYKMKNGHHGVNHPVLNLEKNKGEITAQNNNFSISAEVAQNSTQVKVTHINLNDDTIAGIRVKGKPAFSVQYHPKSMPETNDSRYLYFDFIDLMKSSNN